MSIEEITAAIVEASAMTDEEVEADRLAQLVYVEAWDVENPNGPFGNIPYRTLVCTICPCRLRVPAGPARSNLAAEDHRHRVHPDVFGGVH